MFDRKRKTEFIGCKLTPEEYNYIAEFAAEHNMTISNLIVHSVAEYMARKIVKEENMEEEDK
jgi:hypothetical protein